MILTRGPNLKRWLGRLIGLGVAMLIVATIATGRESSASLTAERDDLSGALTHLAANHGVCAVVAAVIKARRLQSIISAANCDLAPSLASKAYFRSPRSVSRYSVMRFSSWHNRGSSICRPP